MSTIWGNELDEKVAEFNRKVEEIELKHIDLFKDKINRITGKALDKLQHHVMTVQDVSYIKIMFVKDTYVPKYIFDEVDAAFKSVFSK